MPSGLSTNIERLAFRIIGGTLLLLTLLVGGATYLVVQNCNLSKQNAKLKSSVLQEKKNYDTAQKRYSEALVESSKRLVTEDVMDKAVSDLRIENKTLEKELLAAKDNVRVVTKVRTVTREIERTAQPSTRIDKDPARKIEEHVKELVDAAGLGVADVRFKTPASRPWSYKIHPRKYKLDIIQTIQENKPARIIVQGRVEDHRGKTAPLPLVDVTTIVQQPPRPLWTWNVLPLHIELYGTLGMAFGPQPLQPTIGLGLATHIFKRKKNGQDHWRFLGIMLAFSGTMASLTLHPVSWNIGSVVPGLSDTYITAGIGAAVLFTGTQPQVVPAIQLGIGSTL